MFSAKGLAIKRSTGEVVTPFYFSYEDLKEDWAKLSSSQATSSAPSKLVAQVSDFTEVMLLSNGVSKMSLENIDSSAVVSSDSSTLSESQLQAALVNPAIGMWIHSLITAKYRQLMV